MHYHFTGDHGAVWLSVKNIQSVVALGRDVDEPIKTKVTYENGSTVTVHEDPNDVADYLLGVGPE